MPDSFIITGEKLESFTGLTDRRHRQIAKAGYFPPPKDGMYDGNLAIRGVFKYYSETRGDDTRNLAEEKYMKLRADRQLAELKLSEGQKSVIPIAAVTDYLSRLSAKWDQLLTQKLETEIPARLVGKDIVAARAEARVVHDEIREICNAGIVDAEKEIQA